MNEYVDVEIEGRTLARMLDNVMLFNVDGPVDWPKEEKILVALAEKSITLWASDKYSVVRESIASTPGMIFFELTNAQGKAIASIARKAGTKMVTLEYEPAVLFVSNEEWGEGVKPVVGDGLWSDIVAMLPIEVGSGSPDCAIYGWSLERLQRFGRVKVPTGTPKTADIWYQPADRGAIAHVLVGPTFQGALKSLSRETLLRNNPDVKLWDSPES